MDDISEGTLTWWLTLNKSLTMTCSIWTKLHFLTSRFPTGGEWSSPATSFSLLFTRSSAGHFSLCFCFFFFFSSSLLLVLPISVHDLAGAAEARLNCAISYMFTLLASFWAYFPPEHFPSHYSAFPLQRYAVFNLPLWALSWPEDQNTITMSDISYLARHPPYFNTCHKVRFGNWSGV